jgi:hypothetical protein
VPRRRKSGHRRRARDSIGAQQGKLLKQEHARRVRTRIELDGQHIGNDAKGIEVGFLRNTYVLIEPLGRQLVKPI